MAKKKYQKQHKYYLKKDEHDHRDFLYERDKNVEALSLPKVFDLRPFAPPVYDQGDQGSCTANAGCACRSMLAKDPSLYLSRAFQYYNERLIEGTADEDSGASMRDIVKAVSQYGICPDTEMPYSDKDFKTAPSKQGYEDALKYKIEKYTRVSSVAGIQHSLVTRNQPVLLGMVVYESMESEAVAKTGVLPMPQKDEQQLGGHAVLIVGYTDKLPEAVSEKVASQKCECIEKIIDFIRHRKQASGYLIVRNSWGSTWGDHGYFYMPYEYVEAGLAYDFWIME